VILPRVLVMTSRLWNVETADYNSSIN
jgi:hypothetical protein